jgi:ABC-type amino acid transport substrate-binding protein
MFFTVTKRIILMTVSLMIICDSASAKDTVRIVYFSWPPNVITSEHGAEPGKPKGAAVQVWENYIAKKAGVEIKWVGPYPFSRAMAILEAGQADAIQHLSKTPDREKRFIFSSKPIMRGRQGLLVRSDEPMTRIRSVHDLKGKTIGMIGDGYLTPFFNENKKDIVFEKVFGDEAGQQIVRMLLAKRIWGAYFTFPDVLLYHAAGEKRLGEVKVIPFPGSDKEEIIYTAFSRKLDPKMIKRIDDAIASVVPAYDYPSMVQKVFIDINQK